MDRGEAAVTRRPNAPDSLNLNPVSAKAEGGDMGSRTLLLFVLRAALACAALAALPSGAGIIRSAAAPSAPKVDEAQYQRLIEATNAVVGIKVKAIPNARSNETLGAERHGSGVLIGKDGLILTIAYLILEADQVEVTDADGQTMPAAVIAYDHATVSGWCARSRRSRRSRSA
jgi:S1-C subfamily serine protease